MKRFFFTSTLWRIGLLAAACSASACTKTLKPVGHIDISQNTISVGLITPDILLLGSLTQGTTAHTHNLEQPSYLWRTATPNSPITALAYTPAKHQALTASGNNLIIWDTRTGQSLHYLSASATINAIAINPAGTRALLGLDNHQAQVLNLEVGGIVQTLTHSSPVLSVAFNKQFMLTGEEANKAHLWQLGHKVPIATHIHNDGVTKVGFSPDGRYAITASRYDETQLLALKNPKKITLVHSIPLRAMALKAGKRLVDFYFINHTQVLWAYSDHTVEQYDIQQYRTLATWSTAKKQSLGKDNSAVVALGQFQKKWWVLHSNGTLFELGKPQLH